MVVKLKQKILTNTGNGYMYFMIVYIINCSIIYTINYLFSM